jgi:hypothetical protein
MNPDSNITQESVIVYCELSLKPVPIQFLLCASEETMAMFVNEVGGHRGGDGTARKTEKHGP